ncbi:MAG: carboxymuconolactone decarboxylase family protein [Verrucomicrobia bacterium]|nr:carboxymuconolactone decarboxylase family protein [Verrucomicrobiota bacterium]
MARIDPIPMDQMTPEQRRLNDEIAGSRGGGPAKGPFALWLRTPELAEHANAFGSYLRHGTSAPQRLVELAVLIIARAYTAQYEWHAHAAHAGKVGLAPELVEAIRTRREPVIVEEDEKIVHTVTTELTVGRNLSDATYQRAVEILGEQTLLDLVTIIGFYTMVAIVLVGFDVDIPDGGNKPLAE